MSQVRGLADAFDAFIKGCKDDGNWNAIKTGCVMAGWDGLTGALTPLKDGAPTNFNFVSSDYNRETGLLGNGTTKYLNSNRNNNADPQNNFSISTYLTSAATAGTSMGFGGGDAGACSLGASTGSTRNRSATLISTGLSGFTGFHGSSRSSSSSYIRRVQETNATITQASQTPANGNILVFCTTLTGSPSALSDSRQSFYHIGESVDLAKLDSRVTTLMSNIATAIP
jgi:hypothetical protein